MIYPVLQQSSSNIVRRPQNLNQSSTSFLHYLVTSKQSRRLIQIFVGFSEKKNLKKAALLSAVGLNFWATGQPSRNRPQNFLINLGIKLIMHLLKKSIFSLNNDIVRLTKIMNNLVKDLKILSFKVIFQCLKLVQSFQKKFCEEYLIGGQLLLVKRFEKLRFFKHFIYKKCAQFLSALFHIFGKSEDEII